MNRGYGSGLKNRINTCCLCHSPGFVRSAKPQPPAVHPPLLGPRDAASLELRSAPTSGNSSVEGEFDGRSQRLSQWVICVERPDK